MGKPKLYRVILPVSDINKAQEFYSKVLSMTGERVSNGRHYFDCDGTILACFDPQADGDRFDAKPNPDHIYIAVDDLENIYQRVKQSGSAEIIKEIKTWPWGERSFYIKDPFGNPVCFVDKKTVFTGHKK